MKKMESLAALLPPIREGERDMKKLESLGSLLPPRPARGRGWERGLRRRNMKGGDAGARLAGSSGMLERAA
jgi:hypothetical protein